MFKKMYIRPDCCPNYAKPLSENVDCLHDDIVKDWKHLVQRHDCMATRKRRLINLGRPKCIYRRFVPKCACKIKQNIELIHLDDVLHTRTEQLAFPQYRKLVLMQEENEFRFTPERLDEITRLMRYSLLSVYSRLQNIQPPVPPVKKHKWDDEEWKIHRKYLKKLARPKKEKKPPKIPKQEMPFGTMTRYKTLAKPKVRIELEKEKWILKPELKNFEASSRLAELALPKIPNETQSPLPLPTPVSDTAKKYKPSPRILELSLPSDKRNASPEDLKENPYGISPNALKAKPTPRIEELAEPKEYENTTIRENPFAVSPKALKGKATPRLIELAKPKGS